jgi:hypothetical protein
LYLVVIVVVVFVVLFEIIYSLLYRFDFILQYNKYTMIYVN